MRLAPLVLLAALVAGCGSPLSAAPPSPTYTVTPTPTPSAAPTTTRRPPPPRLVGEKDQEPGATAPRVVPRRSAAARVPAAAPRVIPTHRAVTPPTPVRVAGVHPGAFCAPRGNRGTTSTGVAMTCKPGSDGRSRWSRA